jgi:hypothetical protein
MTEGKEEKEGKEKEEKEEKEEERVADCLHNGQKKSSAPSGGTG